MNKKFASLVLVVLSTLALSLNAFAYEAGEFGEIYMTSGEGEYDLKTTYAWDETPWLYVSLEEEGLNVIGSWWQSPEEVYTFEGSDPNTEQEMWLSPNNWDEIKKLGYWQVNAMFFYAGTPTDPEFTIGKGTTGFTVTPEPISTSLFLLGSMALAGRQISRRKKQA